MSAGVQTGRQTFRGTRRVRHTGPTALNAKTEAGRIRKIIIEGGTPQAISVWDHPSADQNRVWARLVGNVVVGDVYNLECPMKNGIRLTFNGATQVVVVYS